MLVHRGPWRGHTDPENEEGCLRGGRRSRAGARSRLRRGWGRPSSSAFVSLAAPGASPTTTAVVFFDTLPGALPPRVLDRLFGVFAAKPSSSVPVTTIDLPSSTCGNDGASGPVHVHAGGPQLLDDLAVAVVVEELADRMGDDRADALDRGDVVLARVEQSVEMAERLGQYAADRAAGVADAEADEQVGERPLLRSLDRLLQVGDGDLAEALEGAHTIPVERVDVGRVVDQIVVEEQRHACAHRAPRCPSHRGW